MSFKNYVILDKEIKRINVTGTLTILEITSLVTRDLIGLETIDGRQ